MSPLREQRDQLISAFLRCTNLFPEFCSMKLCQLLINVWSHSHVCKYFDSFLKFNHYIRYPQLRNRRHWARSSMKLRHSSRKDTRSPVNTCTCIKASSDPPIRDQTIAAIRANMIKIVLLLFLGICGASSTPVASCADGNLSNHTEMDLSPLPGSGNLAEKAIPLWQLTDNEKPLLPVIQIAMEKPQQTTHQLPGTKNLAEKRIPDVILQKFSHPQTARTSDDTFVL